MSAPSLDTPNDGPQEREGLVVIFNPPLYLQRQIWLLNTLAREKVRSVLDIGCGEGNLLQCLSEPSIACFPPEKFQTSDELYIHTVHGLDPSIRDLECTSMRTAPSERNTQPDTSSSWRPTQPPRWTALQVHLWSGGFQNLHHDVFGGDKIDAFVATEVIEHLTHDLFLLFAPVLLGHYRPRLVLLTTPNYTYNQRFHPPDEPPATGYPDPTGRTSRVFRHDDHKFEWTVKEWTDYCMEVAAEYGYNVQVGGIGKSVKPDPWNREDELLGYATQTAIFRRIDDHVVGIPSIVLSLQAPQPDLFITHTHLPHPPSSPKELSIPPSSTDIFKAVQEAFTDNLCGCLSFREIWRTRAVALACKGCVQHLLQAFQTGNFDSDEWNVKDDVENGWAIEVTWALFELPPEPDDGTYSTSTLQEPKDADEIGSSDDYSNEPPIRWYTYQSSVEEEKDLKDVPDLIEDGYQWSSPKDDLEGWNTEN